MGFVKAVKEALLRPFRSTNVQHFHSGSGTGRRHVGVDHGKAADHGKDVEHGKADVQPPAAPSRSAWKRKSKRRTMFLTPVLEEKEEQPAEDKPTGKASKSVAAYVDSASGIGLGVSGSPSPMKKTHILIDLRELTKGINDPDGDQDACDDDGEGGGAGSATFYGHAMPPSQYVKRNSLRMGRSARRKIGIVAMQQSKQGRSSPRLAATKPSHAKTTSAPRRLATDASTMAMLDDIMRSEIKLDVPYLTKENVDTSLPGSTTVSQKANADVDFVPRPLIVPDELGKPATPPSPEKTTAVVVDDGRESCTSQLSKGEENQATYPSQASIQIQRSKSFSGHDPVTQSPMKMFRKHNVTDITVHDVTSAGFPTNGENPVNSTLQTDCRSVNSSAVQNNVENNDSTTLIKPTEHDAVDNEKPKEVRMAEERPGVKKEVKFAPDRSAEQEAKTLPSAEVNSSRVPYSAGLTTKPILARGSSAMKPVQREENAFATVEKAELSTANGDELNTAGRKLGLMRSKSARTHRSVDLAQNMPMKDVLPKTSFFSCHEKSLTEAGYNVKELEKAARLVRIKRSHSRKAKDGGSSHSHSRTSPASGERPKAAYKVHAELKRSKSFMSLTKSTRRKHKSKSSDDGDDCGDSSEIVVNPAPLLRYLQLVVDRPSEYASMRDGAVPITATIGSTHPSFDPIRRTREGVEHQRRTDSLIELNKAFRKCQENFGPPESLVLQALNELGSKRWDSHPISAKLEAFKRAKHLLNKAKKHPLIHNRDNVTQLSATSTPGDGGFDPTRSEVHLTDIEKARGEVEQWLKTLSMAQVIKAKETALRAFGEEEESFSHWWNTNKHCRYIRQAVAAEAT
ncbi:hypothetical protein LSH36_512g03055 [Paralvinella palmiformis]|uniref:Uncharacterized protein n=1 Tax=Paralvinella palmiformis TaxID=53620 RepID=A0AAD9J7Z6_9ANNE|nr:hypothetical protein LSH36_512g03055 [Paralvinella palmiformis]